VKNKENGSFEGGGGDSFFGGPRDTNRWVAIQKGERDFRDVHDFG